MGVTSFYSKFETLGVSLNGQEIGQTNQNFGHLNSENSSTLQKRMMDFSICLTKIFVVILMGSLSVTTRTAFQIQHVEVMEKKVSLVLP